MTNCRRSKEDGEPILPESEKLKELLSELIRLGGSDLLLVHGTAAAIRMEGEVHKIGDALLEGSEIESLVQPVLTPVAAGQYRATQIADSSYRIPGLGRFRINLHRERGRAAATIRALPVKVPALDELRLPVEVGNLAGLRRGLVLIGGAAGAGKSTTLAALVNEINKRDARHIVTIEDPVEYEHEHLRSVIEQVEVGTDAPDFPRLCGRRCARRRTCWWWAR
jgi:Tfp pilus assembly pilus retraction ATPase PilT